MKLVFLFSKNMNMGVLVLYRSLSDFQSDFANAVIPVAVYDEL